jgi:hypothetical protein
MEIKMQTSYFAKYRGENGVSIARYVFNGFTGRKYPPLYPTAKLLDHYKKYNDEVVYLMAYKKETLSILDPQKVYEDLGENAVLLCYERSGTFCHRRIVAEWIENNLGIKVPEITDWNNENDDYLNKIKKRPSTNYLGFV